MSHTTEVLLQAQQIHKRFGPTVALKGVDLTLHRGEIHGLVGENGSGKSTLTSIISGMQKADSGTFIFRGAPWKPESMIDAQNNGISMVLQEMNTISGVTVAENLFAGQESRFSKFGFVSKRKMEEAANKLLEDFGIRHIQASATIDQYGFEDRKLIELARIVTSDTDVLIVDETTTALSHAGRQLLYALMRRFAEEGRAVIFISHDLDEIMEICTVLTVLRDGEIIGSLTKDEMEPKRIRYMMVGREIGDAYYREDYDTAHSGEVVLQFTEASFAEVRDFNMILHKGEIIGIGGLSASGMHSVGRAAFGLEKLSAGSVTCCGQPIRSSKAAISQGIGYISKSRDLEALILQGSIRENIALPSAGEISNPGMFLNPRKVQKFANQQINDFRIKCNSGTQYVETLSGGNKQKVSFAKWIGKGCDIIVMDCPTRGIDIGVKQSIYQMIIQMKAEGKTLLIISEELPELIGMCDRILIMKDGRVSGSAERSPELKETDLIEYMI